MVRAARLIDLESSILLTNLWHIPDTLRRKLSYQQLLYADLDFFLDHVYDDPSKPWYQVLRIKNSQRGIVSPTQPDKDYLNQFRCHWNDCSIDYLEEIADLHPEQGYTVSIILRANYHQHFYHAIIKLNRPGFVFDKNWSKLTNG